MMQTIQNQIQPIAIALIAIASTACATVPSPNTAQPSPPLASPIQEESAGGDYRPIDPQEFLSSRSISQIEPRAVALELFSELTQESEGRKSEQIAIEYPTGSSAIVTVTLVGLADDSVRGMRDRLEFQNARGQWKLVRVGSQSQCQPGRGHQDWSAELCS
jgi:hypothetical protein